MTGALQPTVAIAAIKYPLGTSATTLTLPTRFGRHVEVREVLGLRACYAHPTGPPSCYACAMPDCHRRPLHAAVGQGYELDSSVGGSRRGDPRTTQQHNAWRWAWLWCVARGERLQRVILHRYLHSRLPGNTRWDADAMAIACLAQCRVLPVSPAIRATLAAPAMAAQWAEQVRWARCL